MPFKSKIPDSFEKNLISLYFQHSSIEKVLQVTNYDLPVSFATYHRILNKYGIIKSAGPNSRLSESLEVLSLINSYKVPLERVYHKYAPHSFKISTNTLHRIMHHIRLGATRRCGTALIISRESERDKYLIGQDTTLNRPQLGEAGDFSLPMGHTRMQDSHTKSITRVLQQEVFTKNCIDGTFPFNLVSTSLKPLFFINIADIKVAVFRLVIPDRFHHFSSFKLHNFSFRSTNDILCLKHRPGVGEIVEKYEELRFHPQPEEEVVINSRLNLALSRLPKHSTGFPE